MKNKEERAAALQGILQKKKQGLDSLYESRKDQINSFMQKFSEEGVQAETTMTLKAKDIKMLGDMSVILGSQVYQAEELFYMFQILKVDVDTILFNAAAGDEGNLLAD